jgi:NADPH-ferrihemoprotein reductase
MFADTTTVQEALLWKVDISSYPRKKFIEVMAQFCANAEEKTKLKHLIADGEESVKAYNQLISERVNIVDILELYPSVDMPLEVLLEVVGALQPRYFTISSSNIVNPTTIHITVTVVEERISSGKVFLGVCSNYLKGLRPGKDSIRCTLRKSTFVLPTNPSTPIVMIGPGTGVAPMRAFIQEGTKLNEQGYSPKNWSLYFGCRYNEVDFLYAVIYST